MYWDLYSPRPPILETTPVSGATSILSDPTPQPPAHQSTLLTSCLPLIFNQGCAPEELSIEEYFLNA